MRNRHQDALKKSVLLGYGVQTSWLTQNVHDKCQNLPDPDIFTVDTRSKEAITRRDANIFFVRRLIPFFATKTNARKCNAPPS